MAEQADQKQTVQDVPFSWENEMNEQADRLMQERGESVPPITELLREAESIEKSIRTNTNPLQSESVDLELLLSAQANPSIPEKVQLRPLTKPTKIATRLKSLREGKQPSTDVTQLTSKLQPLSTDMIGDVDPIDVSYQESFASQQESAVIREQMEGLSNRMMTLEHSIEAILAERSHLPTHVKSLREDLNRQLTIMSERLYTALEKGIDKTDTSNVVGSLADTLASSDAVLTVIAEETDVPPSTTSQISSPTPIVSKKRKVKLVL